MRSRSYVVAVAAAVAVLLPGCGRTGSETSSVSDSLAYLGTAEDCANEGKVLVCHVPPGNPANAHSICIDEAAVKAHQKNHGDELGACPRDGGVVPEAEAAENGAGEADAGEAPPGIN
ncbi:MAG: hypothetical protein QM765_32500 [Myxococcales bacterium]